MYFAVSKFVFDLDTTTDQDDKQLASLVTSIRKNFKVAAANASSKKNSDAVLVVAALAPSEEKLSHLLNEISKHCEESGFGRVESEETLLDHIDTINSNEEIERP